MSREPASNLKLKIGHVLFVDIVGYSRLLINQQSELLRELNEILSGTKQFREADAEGKLIRLPTGDGMALVPGQMLVSVRASAFVLPLQRALR